jgi:hypothetical protein
MLPFRAFDPGQALTQEEKWRSIFVDEPQQTSRYSLFVQKQSGIESAFVSHIVYPKGWEPAWETGGGMDLGLNGANINMNIDVDKVFGLVMKKE